MIFLDDLIDEKKTIATVKRYLKQYPRLKTIARTTSSLTSNWNVSDKIKTRTNSNIQEDKLLNRIAISQEVEEIEQVISGLEKLHKEILIEKYIKRQKKDVGLYQDMNMSEASFYKALQIALLDFAYAFKNGSLLQYLDS